MVLTPQQCETIKIKSTHPTSQGAYITINKSDFDDKMHEIYSVDAPTAPTVNASKTAIAAAEKAGMKIEALAGTGKGGSVTVNDVKAAVAAREATLNGEDTPPPPPANPDVQHFEDGAKELAGDAGFDVVGLVGSGVDGLILTVDVANAIIARDES